MLGRWANLAAAGSASTTCDLTGSSRTTVPSVLTDTYRHCVSGSQQHHSQYQPSVACVCKYNRPYVSVLLGLVTCFSDFNVVLLENKSSCN